MIFVENEGHFILLSKDDDMLETIKQSVPNAKVVNMTKEEYNQHVDNLENLETVIRDRIK